MRWIMKTAPLRLLCLAFLLTASASTGEKREGPRFSRPLEVNDGISGTFGEYRGLHLHMGLDLRTGGRTGLKVLAAADGRVSRIKCTWRGYGKALYIEHGNGLVTVYGHLERFENRVLRLEDILEEKRRSTGLRYPGDIFLKRPIPVRRGQLIAYSGETGAGRPHLHFEIRKDGGTAVDPMLYGIDPGPGGTPPVFQSIRVSPAEASCTVDGTPKETELRLRKSGDAYVSDAVPAITGPFDISADLYDESGADNRCGVASLKLVIDGKVEREFAFSEISYERYKWGGLVYDLEESRMAPTVVYRYLFHMPGRDFPLPAARGEARPLAAGKHLMEIVAVDGSGLTSVARQPFLTGKAPRITRLDVDEAARPGRKAKLVIAYEVAPGTPTKELGDPQFVLEAVDGPEGKRFVPLEAQPSEENGAWSAVVPHCPGFLRASVRVGGFSSPWATRIVQSEESPPPKDPEASLALALAGPTVEIRLQTSFLPSKEPAVTVLRDGAASETVPLQAETPREFSAALPAPGATCTLQAVFDDGRLPGDGLRSNTLHLQYLSASEPRRVETGPCRIDFPAHSLFEDTLFSINTREPEPSGVLPPAGPAIEIAPRRTPFRKEGRLSFTLSPKETRPEKTGVYLWNKATGTWGFQDARFDQSTRTVSAEISRGGLYGLLYDEVPPTISALRPRSGSTHAGPRVDCTASVGDIGTGIDWDGVTFTIDGRRIIAEYDPDRREASIPGGVRLKNGKHRLTVEAVDRAGNRGTPISVVFAVK
jgi:hypothetical protein